MWCGAAHRRWTCVHERPTSAGGALTEPHRGGDIVGSARMCSDGVEIGRCDAMAAASRDRQARDDQRVGDFRAQLDEVRAAKEEACRDAVDWAEESSRFKGEVTALLTKCQKLEEDKAAAIESNDGLEADLAAARRETDEVVGRLEGAVASLAQAKTEQERLCAETLARDFPTIRFVAICPTMVAQCGASARRSTTMPVVSLPGCGRKLLIAPTFWGTR